MLCVATSAVWLRSSRTIDAFSYWGAVDANDQWRSVFILSTAGRLRVQYTCRDRARPMEYPIPPSTWRSYPVRPELLLTEGSLGFWWSHDSKTYDREPPAPTFVDVQSLVQFPYWAAALLCSICPAIAIARALQRRRRFLPQTCHECGYDLRATPQRCPECGTIPKIVEPRQA